MRTCEKLEFSSGAATVALSGMKLVIATSNQGKYRELRALLRIPELRLCWLADFPPLPQATEEGRSFAENAQLKAAHYHRLLRLPVVADDSGLQVDLLGGEPGIHSARYAGPAAGDRENLEKLLRRLQRRLAAPCKQRAGAQERPRRLERSENSSSALKSRSGRLPPDLSAGLPRRLLSPARFVCVLSLFAMGQERFSAEGRCEGLITAEPKGDNGFGYDPLFFVPAEGKTLAELPSRVKNRISHRAAAARQLRRFLLENLPRLFPAESASPGGR